MDRKRVFKSPIPAWQVENLEKFEDDIFDLIMNYRDSESSYYNDAEKCWIRLMQLHNEHTKLGGEYHQHFFNRAIQHDSIIHVIEGVETLKHHYSETTLLEMVDEYYRILQDNDITIDLFQESLETNLKELENQETNVDKLINEAVDLLEQTENLIDDLSSEDEKEKENAKTTLQMPIYLLQVIFIYYHDNYHGIESFGIWLDNQNNKSFEDRFKPKLEDDLEFDGQSSQL